MTDTAARRHGHGEDAIYFDATNNRCVGAVSLGFEPNAKRSRRKVAGRTKPKVRHKLKVLHAELDRGPRISTRSFAVTLAKADLLEITGTAACTSGLVPLR
jgi:hypothetical protein